MRDCGRFSPEKNSQVSKKKVLLGALDMKYQKEGGEHVTCSVVEPYLQAGGQEFLPGIAPSAK